MSMNRAARRWVESGYADVSEEDEELHVVDVVMVCGMAVLLLLALPYVLLRALVRALR